MVTESGSVAVTGGTIKGSDEFSNKEDTQYVTLTDGGDFSYLKLANFGKNAPTEAGDGPGGDDEFYFDLRTFDDDFNIELASLDEGDTLYFTMVDSYTVDTGDDDDDDDDDDNETLIYTITYTGSDGQSHTVVVDLFSAVTDKFVGIDITLACFAKGTEIETYHGPCAVQDLDVGERVLCGDGQHRIIQWIASRHISDSELNNNPNFRPIRFRAGSLGHNLPKRDLVVSPQHRILIEHWRAELMFGAEEVLVPAKFLINDKTIARDTLSDEVTYYHFMFDSHQTVISNGVETESFHPGDMALTGVVDAARDELFALFPQLESEPDSFGPTCMPTLKAFEAEALFAAE